MDGTIPVGLVRVRLANERAAKVDPEPVIAVLSREMEVWRFNLQRLDADPQPAQWRELVSKVEIPELPTFAEMVEVRRSINALPAKVIGVMTAELFKRAGIGRPALLERMQEAAWNGTADPADAALLRGVVADMAEALGHVKGKRGPRLKQDIGPVLRAVHGAIMANSSMGDVPARDLASDLLNMCGIAAPKGRSRLAELMRPIP